MEKTSTKTISVNKKAWHDFFVLESLETGIELVGTEVKSIRKGGANLKDSWCSIDDGEMFVKGMHISSYEQGNIFNKDPLRVRKLLIHKSEIMRLLGSVKRDGLTLIPISLYFKGSKVKLQLGVCKGKKLHDKREDMASRDANRDIDRAMKERIKGQTIKGVTLLVDYIIREIHKNEIYFLDDFLYEAIFIPEGTTAPAKSIIYDPFLQVYVKDFGKIAGDYGLVAEINKCIVGAVWVRIMNDYGHVDDETPSFAISLYRQYRGKGIGSNLMKEMLKLLKEKGYKQTSLAVQKHNYALKMYQNVGFEIIKESEEEYLMLYKLN